jgi:hypothetical protein
MLGDFSVGPVKNVASAHTRTLPASLSPGAAAAGSTVTTGVGAACSTRALLGGSTGCAVAGGTDVGTVDDGVVAARGPHANIETTISEYRGFMRRVL